MDNFTPANVDVVLHDPSMARIADQLRTLIRPSIRLHMQVAEEKSELPLGGTRFGGLPDLPIGTVWPTAHLDISPPSEAFRATDKHSRFLPEGGTFSLPFVAQIRLSEISACDGEKRLPASGLLYFFYNEGGFTTDTGDIKHGTTTIDGQVFSFAIYGYDDPAIWRVLYIPDEETPLERTPHPADVPEDQQYRPSVPAAVFTEPTLPHVETCFIGDPNDKSGMVTLTAEEWQAYAELHRETRVSPTHQMLGHSDDSQPFAMEGSFRRIRSELFPELRPWESLSEAEQQQEYTSGRLLLQIDAHENRMWFGRGGALYFFIRESDLAARDFSRVWATAQ
jgi:hypothetical protein